MTSGTGNGGPTAIGSAPQSGESKPPQAVVKPQILTHVIEGFVIQEGAEPFPVERPPHLMANVKQQTLQPDCTKLSPSPASDDEANAHMEDLSQSEREAVLKCELCGLEDLASNFKRSRRFCSTVCAKRYSVRCSKRMGLIHPDRSRMEKHKKGRPRGSTVSTAESKNQVPLTPPLPSAAAASPHPRAGGSSQCSDMSSYEEPPSPPSARPLPLLPQHFLPRDPARWNVTDVYQFIRSLPGCQEIAEEFRSQEIDGQALLLLKEDHLMSAMNIKLGPAVKIFARISLLKDS